MHSSIIPPKEQQSNAYVTKDRQLKEDSRNSHSKYGDGITGSLSRTSPAPAPAPAPQRITQGNQEFREK